MRLITNVLSILALVYFLIQHCKELAQLTKSIVFRSLSVMMFFSDVVLRYYAILDDFQNTQ